MVTTDVELQLTQQLKEAWKRLSRPPTSDDELLFVLDQTEKLLSMVDQSPNELMKEALNPLIKGFVDKSLLEHSNEDVKVAVASCLSEITRVTAPEAPYGDEELKAVFELIVSTFENLSDNSSRSYNRRASILDTVCKVRSCVIMLDLECEELVVQMFENFIKSIREHHPENILSSMVEIMALIFEEIEEITENMVKPLLFIIKNDSEGVLPVTRKLGEKVFQKSKKVLGKFLNKNFSNWGDSFDNYSPVLASICEGPHVLEKNNETALTDESKLANEHSEDVPQVDENKITTVSSEVATQVVKENTEKPAEIIATPNRTLKIVMSNGGRITMKEKKDSPVKDSSKKLELNSPEKDSSKKPELNSPEKESSKKPEVNSPEKESSKKPEVNSPEKESSKKPEEVVDHQDSSLTSKVDINDSVAEVANVESKPESNKEDNKIDDTIMESVEPENKNEKENDIQEKESKPEENNNEGNKSDVIITSAEPSDSSHGENKDEKTEEKNDENEDKKNDENEDKKNDENEDKKNDENKDEKNDDIQVSVMEIETEVPKGVSENENLPEESKVEKVDLSTEEKAEVAKSGPQSESGGLPYKIHIRKGPRSKKKNLMKDDTPLIEVIKKASELINDSNMKSPKSVKKKTPIVQKDEKDEKKTDTVGSGAKSEKKSGRKVGGGGGGSVKRKRKVSGKKSGGGGGGGSGAKKAKQDKSSTPLIEKDDESDSFDKPLRQTTGKEDESDSDSKPIKSSVKKGNIGNSSVVKSSVKNKDGKKNESGKNVEEKDESKSLNEDDEMEITPKSKTVTDEGKSEESSKRKRSVSKNNANKNVKYDDSLIGLKVKVWWPDDKKYYEGVIESFYSAKNKHKVSYVDGDEEILNLKKEKWEILEEFSARNEEKPTESETSDDEILSKMITYKSKGKINNSIKSKGLDEKELEEDGDGDDDEVTPEKSTEGKKSGSKGGKGNKRKKKM